MSSLPAQIDNPNALDVVTAVLCAADVPAKAEIVIICDAFVGGASPAPTDDDINKLAEYMEAHRAVRWQDQLDALLDTR